MQDVAAIILIQSVKALSSKRDLLWVCPFLLYFFIPSSPDEQHNMIVDEGDKLQNWCDALIAVSKHIGLDVKLLLFDCF